jgi:hypothetical protein
MKKLLLFAFIAGMFVFTSGNAFARDFFISAQGGYGFPVGGYTDEAEQATIANFDFGMYMDRDKSGGVFGRYIYLFSPLKTDKLDITYSGEGLFADKDFAAHCFLPGYYHNVPINRRSGIEARLMLGALFAQMPAITNEDGSVTYLEEADNTTFATMLSLGYKYSIIDELDIFAEFSYLNSSPIFYDDKIEGEVSYTEYKRNIHMLNLTIGIRFNF